MRRDVAAAKIILGRIGLAGSRAKAFRLYSIAATFRLTLKTTYDSLLM